MRICERRYREISMTSATHAKLYEIKPHVRRLFSADRRHRRTNSSTESRPPKVDGGWLFGPAQAGFEIEDKTAAAVEPVRDELPAALSIRSMGNG